MDPVTIGTAVVTILSPYVADAGKELVKAAGEVGLEKARGLMTWLKQQFAGDSVAASDLSRFEQNPKVFAPSLQATIEKKATTDPAFSAAIAERVKELGPMITIIQEFNDARDLTGVDGAVRSGHVSVTQKGTTASNVTGIKGTIG
jgi:hypothetical protein